MYSIYFWNIKILLIWKKENNVGFILVAHFPIAINSLILLKIAIKENI